MSKTTLVTGSEKNYLPLRKNSQLAQQIYIFTEKLIWQLLKLHKNVSGLKTPLGPSDAKVLPL